MCEPVVHQILFKSQKLKILRRDEMLSLLMTHKLNTAKPSEMQEKCESLWFTCDD